MKARHSGSSKLPAAIVGIFVVGFALAWLIKPVRERIVQVKATKIDRGDRPGSTRKRARDAEVDWAERLKHEDATILAKEAKDGEFKALVEAAMAGMWGDLSGGEVRKLKDLIMEWAARDIEGALAWARSLENGNQRSLAFVSIAESLKDLDLEKAYEVFCELDRLEGSWRVRSGVLNEIVQSHLQQFAGLPPGQLVAELEGVPDCDVSSPVPLEYPESYDFAALIQCLHEQREKEIGERGPFGASKAYYIESPFREWAKRDLDSAIDHALAAEEYSPDLAWGGFLTAAEARKLGMTADEVRQLIAGKLNQLGLEEFDRSLKYSNVQHRNDLSPALELMRYLEPERAERMEAALKRWGRLEE